MQTLKNDLVCALTSICSFKIIIKCPLQELARLDGSSTKAISWNSSFNALTLPVGKVDPGRFLEFMSFFNSEKQFCL